MVTLHLRLEQFISGFQNFRSGHMGTSDAERFGRPVEVTTPEIIDKIHDMVMDDRRSEGA
uniref:Uncharacterized protein n=1 Tax=Rhodnius prolixus TaxID=13249 RepID=T1HKV1_RHOPR